MTISADTSPVDAVRYALLGGRFRVRLNDDQGPGRRSGSVLDEHGQPIGSASDYTYGGRGFAVHTQSFAGFVPTEQIDFA